LWCDDHRGDTDSPPDSIVRYPHEEADVARQSRLVLGYADELSPTIALSSGSVRRRDG
jgi:hypothetical protein